MVNGNNSINMKKMNAQLVLNQPNGLEAEVEGVVQPHSGYSKQHQSETPNESKCKPRYWTT